MSRRSADRKRQEKFPAWMQIEDMAFPDPIQSSFEQWHATSRPEAEPPPPEPLEQPPDLPDDVASALATDLWRATRRVGSGNGNGDGSPENAATLRDLEQMRERLRRAGIEYQSHDGLVYKAGMQLDVVSWQPTDESPPDVVLETVRPSVYRTGTHDPIQVGRVIVAKSSKEG